MSSFFAHLLQCYFILSASDAVPILYHVDRIRDGRSYVTRAVRAVQRGRTVFMMMCSFQLPEPRQPSYQYPMPPDVPAPEACEGIEVIYEKLLRDTTDEKVKGFCRTMLEVRSSMRTQHRGYSVITLLRSVVEVLSM